MKIKTIEKKGYKLHLIENPNFKTILVKAIFWEKIKKEEITIRNMLVNNLLFSSANYRTEKELSIKKEELYGANLGGGNYRKSNYILSEINLAYIEDKYSEKNQSKNTIEFFFDVLLNPNIENNKFYKPSFDICYEMIKSDIKAENESPGYLSNKEYKKIIGKDKPFSLSITGTKEDLDKVTPETLYEYYKKFIKNNNIDIFVIGNIKKYKIEDYFKDLEETTSDYDKNYLYVDYEKEFSEEKIKTKFYQSKLIMGGSLKNFTNHEKKYELLLFNIIFGNSPNSKLFKVVREKHSYAYSISSSVNRLDGIFQINAGISKQNYEGAKNDVLLQLDEMKKGNFTKQDLKDAKAVVMGLIREINDYQNSIIDDTFNSMYFDHDKEHIRIEEIMKVTKEDIIKVANKINIDTIFLAEEKDNEKIRINNFKEKLYYEELENGIKVYLVPLKNKNNYTFMLGTKYGGRDINFKINDELIKTPTGIAHFLEHKLFEKEDNPFKFYQKSGTDVNASTSHDYTAYYILGNIEYYDNIKYLLNWLKQLNLTEEQVEKEKGIILEESGMYKDNPDRILAEKLRTNIFIEDPYRNKVIGIDEDIKRITKEEVVCCYNSFYSPNNMFIISVGNFKPKKTMKIIKENTKTYKNPINKIEKYYGNEPDKVNKKDEEIFMSIDLPRVGVAYKINKTHFDKLKIDDFQLDLYLHGLINIGFGLTSDIREKWLKEKLLINSSYRILRTDKHYIIEFYAISEKPDELSEKMQKYIKNIQTDKDSFERQKKIWISGEVKAIANIHSTEYNILDDVLEYDTFIPNKIEIIRNMTFENLEKVKHTLDFKNKVIVKIKPDSKNIVNQEIK